MTYDEMGSGGVSLRGCGPVTLLHSLVTSFSAGDILFNIKKARRGVLEKVVVKTTRVVANRRTFGAKRVLYTDTLNGLWNEDELVPYQQAVALAEAYYQNMLDTLSQRPTC